MHFEYLSDFPAELSGISFQFLLQIFDRELKRRQRNWAVRQADFDDAQYLKEEIGWRVADRVFDLTKFNPLALDIGCGVGHVAPHMIKENVGTLIQCDISEAMVEKSKGADDAEVKIERVVCDEELLEPFTTDQFDLLLSSLSGHWINDLPRWFRRCHDILKPDCPFIGALLAEDSLYELRCSLQLAEVGYPHMLALMYDLQLMAESHCTFSRSRTVRRDVLIAADAIYRAMYAKDDKYPATFRVLSFIGWKPGPTMPKPAKRGSQNVSFKDLGKIIEDPEMIEKLSAKKDDNEKK
ncbi:unnamed protein product [Nippostrongylus brasiliensis]|uniref:Arginine-hydroxylase NDUFAF5, mitochondrial n=1 Tax=Nippostrongylus brasiliensis TaxID=27835 RepID=A0A158QYX9_NIPBR|nr:unnamed protein product [Nippostrongylus brasiliensis]